MSPPGFSQMKPRTLKENVVSILREAIITGVLSPDAELNQAHIAQELGISRGPVREALGQLEQEGFIRNVPYKGVYVTPLTPKYVEDLYSLRGALEVFAVQNLIIRLHPEHLTKLNEIVSEMRAAAHEQDAQKLAALDLSFHHYIVEQADNEPLLQAWTPLEMGVRRCLHTRHRIYDSMDQVVGSHPALVQAIAEKNVEVATRLLHEHIIDAGEKILSTQKVIEPENSLNGCRHES